MISFSPCCNSLLKQFLLMFLISLISVQNEIKERQDFLKEMEALGQGDKYRSIIATEISQVPCCKLFNKYLKRMINITTIQHYFHIFLQTKKKNNIAPQENDQHYHYLASLSCLSGNQKTKTNQQSHRRQMKVREPSQLIG